MKNLKFLTLFVFLIVQLGAVNTNGLAANLVIFHDGHHDDFTDDHDTADGLEANYTAAGSTFNTVGVNDTFAIPASSNVALFPGSDAFWTAADYTAVSTWFETDGPKLVIVAADSDYSSFFNYSQVHDLLDAVDSKLRFVDGEIQDETSNDGQPYRVVTTGFPTDGEVNAVTSVGVSKIVTHGPTGVAYADGDGAVAIDGQNGVEVLANTAATSFGFDGDLSDGAFDLYDNTDGPFPVVVLEEVDENKFVIAAGEAFFSDYKNMYGHNTEGGETHDGDTFVDNILTWFGGIVTEPLDDFLIRTSSDSPISIFGVFAAIIAVPVIVRRFRK